MSGLLGKKIGMTQIFDEKGNLIPVTVIEAGPCYVTQVRTKEKDGYTAIQIGFGNVKKLNKPITGHLKDIKVKHLKELRLDNVEGYKVGQELKADIFKQGETVTITGKTIGKGFAGTVKMYHFGRGPMTHGSKFHRLPGSIGAGTTPSRVIKGKLMPKRMGGVKCTVPNSKIAMVDSEKNLLLIKGQVPGSKNNIVLIRKKS